MKNFLVNGQQTTDFSRRPESCANNKNEKDQEIKRTKNNHPDGDR